MSEAAASVSAQQVDDDAPPTAKERLRAALGVPVRLLAALFMPDKAVPRDVGAGRYGGALLAILLCHGLAAYAIGSRLDVTLTVIAKQSGGEGGGPGMRRGPPPGAAGAEAPQLPTDREVREAIAKEKAIRQVKLGLGAGLWTPIKPGLLAILIFLIGRFVGGAPTFRRCYTALVYSALPGAVQSLIGAGVAFHASSVTPEHANTLIQPAPINAVFGLWSLVIFYFGFAEAAQISRLKAFLTLLYILALFAGLMIVVMR